MKTKHKFTMVGITLLVAAVVEWLVTIAVITLVVFAAVHFALKFW